uniref:Uncharacterized protein n=1 Tax=Anguilla anguilla TaxID=7936 RepID=A0A0E9S740_ANGAN
MYCKCLYSYKIHSHLVYHASYNRGFNFQLCNSIMQLISIPE